MWSRIQGAGWVSLGIKELHNYQKLPSNPSMPYINYITQVHGTCSRGLNPGIIHQLHMALCMAKGIDKPLAFLKNSSS